MHLRPGTTYDIELRLQTLGAQTTLSARTWTQKFPVAQITENFESGIEDGYVILTGETIYGLPFIGQDEITIVPSK